MAFEVTPPKSNHILDIQQAWYRLRDLLNAEYIDTGWGNVLFVDAVDGNDDTAQSGSITYAYATIQAALDAATEGDVVWVGPGTYTEALTWPDTNNVTLRGVGDATNITSAEAAGTIAIAPTADVVADLKVLGVNILNSGLGACLSVDGTNCPGLGSGGDIIVRDVAMRPSGGTAISLSVCGDVALTNIDAIDDVELAQTGQVLMNNVQYGTLLTDNDPTGIEPTAGFGSVTMTASTCGGVALRHLAQLAGTDDVQVQGDFEAEVTDTATAFGSVNFSGRILGNVQVTFDLDDAPVTVGVFDHARITGSFFCGRTAGGSGAEIGRVRALHATFFSTGAGDITADSSAELDIRGANFAQAALASTDTEGTVDGVIDRSWWVQTIGDGNSGDPVAWGVPYATAPSFVSVESDTIGELPIAVNSYTTTEVTCTKTLDEEPHKVLAYLAFD